MKLVSVGEASADFYSNTNQTLVGGISLNFAVQAKRCGVDAVSLVSRVGNDANGKLIVDKLADEQIDASHVAVVDGKTAHCEIVVLENGERYFPPNSYHQNVLADFVPDTQALSFIQTHDVVVCRYDITYTKVAFDLIMCDLPFAGKKVADFGDWFDYDGRHEAIFPYLDQIDLAFISGDAETVEVFRRAMSQSKGPISHHNKAQVVITLGENGSVALVNGNTIRQAAIPVANILDTTGCGDAFQAAFTVNYFQSNDLKNALHAGAVHASTTLQHLGAI